MRCGRTSEFWGRKSVILQMHSDIYKLFSTVDDLQLDAHVIDRSYRELFKVHEECTELGSAVRRLINFDVHATGPFFCH